LQVHPTLIALLCGGLVVWARPASGASQAAEDRATGYFASPQRAVDALPCVRAETCRILRARDVPECPSLMVVETLRTRREPSDGASSNSDLGCIRQAHWLLRGDGSPPVLLVEDCSLQEGTDPPGASATEIVGCDISFRYFELRKDSTCRIRQAGVHLDTLQPYGEIESEGVLTRNAGYTSDSTTRRRVHLPRGKGTLGSPLIVIDGPAVVVNEPSLSKAAKSTSSSTSTASTAEPACVGTGTCRIASTRILPKCPGKKIMETRSTMGSTKPDADAECVERSHWLIRDGGTPVLLAEDCESQVGAATTGVSTIQIEKCALTFKYVEQEWDDECIVREIGIHLDELGIFRESERDGVIRKSKCTSRTGRQRPVHLRRGRGTAESPLIELDNSLTQEIPPKRKVK
jgi:hypothetical protein